MDYKKYWLNIQGAIERIKNGKAKKITVIEGVTIYSVGNNLIRIDIKTEVKDNGER